MALEQHVLLLGHDIVEKVVPTESTVGRWLELYKGYTASYFCNGRRFQVLVTNRPPADCDQEGAVETIWAEAGADLGYGVVSVDPIIDSLLDPHDKSDELLARVTQLVLPTILELAAPSVDDAVPTGPANWDGIPYPRTAEEHVFSETIKLQLVTKGGVLQIIHGHNNGGPSKPAPIPWGQLTDFALEGVNDMPRFSSADVTILGHRHEDNFDAVVSASGDKAICVMMPPPDESPYWFLKQLENMVKLHRSGLSAEARVPDLVGIVTHGDGIIGFLLAPIVGEKMNLYQVLDNSPYRPPVDSAVSLARKRKWIGQIEQALSLVHGQGIVWGRAHPENIVIDGNDDAWLTGFTDDAIAPYVPRLGARSVETDLNALEMIRQHLSKGVSKL